MKKIVIALAVGFFVIFFGLFLAAAKLLPAILPVLKKFPETQEAGKGRAENGLLFSADEADKGGVPAPVVIFSPNLEEALPAEFILAGRAPGGWFQDGFLAVSLVDGDGRKLATSYAGGQGVWTRDSEVDFSARFEYQPPLSDAGSLVFLNGEDGSYYSVLVRFR